LAEPGPEAAEQGGGQQVTLGDATLARSGPRLVDCEQAEGDEVGEGEEQQDQRYELTCV